VLPRDEDLVSEIETISETPVQAEDMVDGDIEQILEEDAEEAREQELESIAEKAEASQPQLNSSSNGSSDNNNNGKKSMSLLEAEALLDFMRSGRKQDAPDYGEVMLDQHGEILEYRKRVFHIDPLMHKIVRGSDSPLLDGIGADEYAQEIAAISAEIFDN
jgi:hypothetical protein